MVGGEFDMSGGLLVGSEVAERFVVRQIHQLRGAVVARNGQNGAVGRPGDIANSIVGAGGFGPPVPGPVGRGRGARPLPGGAGR